MQVMKDRTKHISFFASGVAVGILAGICSTAMYYHRQVPCTHSEIWNRVIEERSDRWLFKTLEASLFHNVKTLIGLSEGRFDVVIEYQENRLSEDIYDLASNFPQKVLSDTNCVNTLRLAARYRAKRPFRTGIDDIDEVVAKTLHHVLSTLNDEVAPDSKPATPNAPPAPSPKR
jgi:hypothetical protein